jgi:glycosyltransferase involved in cell wall biosynthesis
MPKLSVIIPYCNEYPMIMATLRSVHEELKDIDHQIVAVDNYCEEVRAQGRLPDSCHSYKGADGNEVIGHIQSMARINPWLKYLKYDKVLSHWAAKKFAIDNTDSPFIMFVDAHCIPSRDSLSSMFKYYEEHYKELDGTIALPLSYHLLEDRRLIYKLLFNEKEGQCEYTFSSLPRRPEIVFQVPCMSSCGCLLTRDLYNLTGGFPQRSAYSGGEQFLNFTLAVLGKKVWIYNNGSVLHHHGAPRGYSYNWHGYQVNRALAALCFGGEKWLKLYVDRLDSKGVAQNVKDEIYNEAMVIGYEQHKSIKEKQVISIEEWATKLKP